MPLFSVTPTTFSTVDQTNFSAEEDLQALIEKNLSIVFGCRLVATEFPTGLQHSGRIDTLALSEDNNPVILEYKKIESSDLINQTLFYLAWLQDHRGDFEIAAQKKLGPKIVVDWSDIRVICLAPNYKRYDLHAVQVMGANLELWTYRLFENGTLYLEEVFKKSVTTTAAASGQKAARPKKTVTYTVTQHLEGKSKKIQELVKSISEFLLGLDPAMEEVPKKLYLAYKISQNIACVEVQKKRVLIFVKLDPKKVAVIKNITRDVTNIGHFGTGNLELSVRTSQDLDHVKPLLEQAYQKVGG